MRRCSKEAGFAFGKKVRDRADAIGRDSKEILIVPGVVPIVADTYDAALRRHELVSGTDSEDGLLKRFVKENGIEPDGFNPDAILDAERLLPDQNRILAVGMGRLIATTTPPAAVADSQHSEGDLVGTPRGPPGRQCNTGRMEPAAT